MTQLERANSVAYEMTLFFFQVRTDFVPSVLCSTVFQSVNMATAAMCLGSGIPNNGKLLLRFRILNRINCGEKPIRQNCKGKFLSVP